MTNQVKVYLAGGMRSGWQKLMPKNPNVIYFDPTDHKKEKPELYSKIDAWMIRECDILFAYMETTNPSGKGMCLEIGYAKALGKYIIFVNETDDRYFALVEKFSDYVTKGISDGHEELLATVSLVSFPAIRGGEGE